LINAVPLAGKERDIRFAVHLAISAKSYENPSTRFENEIPNTLHRQITEKEEL
jgi:hypothetical protein